MSTKKSFTVVIFGILLAKVGFANTISISEANAERYRYPFYVGLSYGYGSTTWEYLVPDENNVALALSTPTKSREGGPAWGAIIGYELIPTFGLELAYQRYANANVTFDEYSLISYENDIVDFATKTETVSLVGKFMLFIPTTQYRVFASAGAAEIHRADMIYNHWHLSPTFGVGINVNATPHFMAEVGGDYTAGDGVTELSPSDHFVPFLWSMHLRLAYRL